MDTYYLTTAIDYVNAAPHIGHAYEKIAADILARYYRLAGKAVFFLTGTDEHGSKVEKTAAAAGKTPVEFTTEMAEKFQHAWKSLNLSNDYFIRTTEPRHEQVVQEVFRKMHAKGDVYKGTYQGLYCEGCEDYLRERDLVDGKCPNHGRAPIQAEETNYFFRLTKYKEPLRKWLSQEGVVRPDGRRKEVINQLDDEEFGDFSVSRPRTSLQWGIPVPDDPDHVIYVWIDALTNYITGAGYLTDEKQWQRYWPANLHLIGKDILKFHAIFWPAMLMSCDIELPKMVFGHGFITVEGQKMSKTLGNVLDPVELVERYGSDAIRYYLFAANTFDQDGDFRRADLVATVNGHLANNYGNLLNRTLKLVESNCQGLVPDGIINPTSLTLAEQREREYHNFMGQLEFSKALDAVRCIIDEANRYLNDRKPWTLFKEGNTAEGASVLLTSLELLKRATVLYAPVVPELAARVWNQLGYEGDVLQVKLSDEAVSQPIAIGQAVRNSGPPFPRLEDTPAVATK